MTPQTDINVVKERHAERLMSIDGVVGVYVGQTDVGVPCIGVLLRDDDPALLARIPDSLDGYLVRKEISGPIRPMR